MVEVAGIEPASAIISISSHPQVCLVYYHKPEKIDGMPCAYRPVALHLRRGIHFDFLFSQDDPSCYSLLGNEVSEDPASYAAKATA